MVEFQPSKLAVVGSNPIARSNLHVRTTGRFEATTGGIRRGYAPFVGRMRGGWPPLQERGEPATECGSNPIARSNFEVTLKRDLKPRQGGSNGIDLLRGDDTGGRAPLSGVDEGRFRTKSYDGADANPNACFKF